MNYIVIDESLLVTHAPLGDCAIHIGEINHSVSRLLYKIENI